jgi:hypothetical protein
MFFYTFLSFAVSSGVEQAFRPAFEARCSNLLPKVFLSDRDPSLRSGLRKAYSSVAFTGGFNPRYFIAICRSFHVSFFCRGSRSRYAGW